MSSAPYIVAIVGLVLECVVLSVILFPLPRVVWKRIHHYVFVDERRTVKWIKYGLGSLLVAFTVYVTVLCFESLIRLIHYSTRRHHWYHWRKFVARDDFFLAGPTFLVSLVLMRTLYIVLSHLHLQEQLIEVNGKDTEAQPMSLSSGFLYKRRSLKPVQDAFYRVRSSLGLSPRIRLPSSDSSDANFKDDLITKQEREIAELRNALAQAHNSPSISGSGSPTGSDMTARANRDQLPETRPQTNTPGSIPSDVNALISSQEKEIAELKSVVRSFSETLKAQAASQAAEYDKLAAQYNQLAMRDMDEGAGGGGSGKGKSKV